MACVTGERVNAKYLMDPGIKGLVGVGGGAGGGKGTFYIPPVVVEKRIVGGLAIVSGAVAETGVGGMVMGVTRRMAIASSPASTGRFVVAVLGSHCVA